MTDGGYAATSATTGAYAEHLLQAQGFALIVLDLGLPDIDGLELMSRLRHLKTPLPILILTAQDGVNDRIKGIEQGAGPMCCQSLSGCFSERGRCRPSAKLLSEANSTLNCNA